LNLCVNPHPSARNCGTRSPSHFARLTLQLIAPSRKRAAEALHQARLVPVCQGVFPNPENAPTLGAQHAIDLPIPCAVPVQLPLPEPAIMPGLRAMLRATVPETPVHKNRHPPCAERKIRFPKQTRLPPPAGDAMPPQNPRLRPREIPFGRATLLRSRGRRQTPLKQPKGIPSLSPALARFTEAYFGRATLPRSLIISIINPKGIPSLSPALA
jgi:hypothetical protein